MAQILKLKTKLRHPVEHARAEHKNAVAYFYSIKAMARDSEDDMMYQHARNMLKYAIDRKQNTLDRLKIINKVE